jgi:subtilisin family serine protease
MSSIFRNKRPRSSARQINQSKRFSFESLESRNLMAGLYPNDPQFPQQWPLHNTGQTGGLYDADIDMPEAWSVTTGSMSTVVAVLDSGIDYTHPDVYLNIWINQDEIPATIVADLTDVDADDILTFRDLNAPANGPYVTNLNGNAYIDAGDLLNDPRWENGLDDDGNGKIDDLVMG